MFACKVAVHAQVSSCKVGLLTNTETLRNVLGYIMELQCANSNSYWPRAHVWVWGDRDGQSIINLATT